MEEMKQQFQSNLKNLREKGQQRQEVASKSKRHFSNELEGGGGGHYENLREASEFHCSPMQPPSPHRREGGNLENVA